MEQEYGSTAAVNNDSPSQEPTVASDNSMTVLKVEKKPLRFVTVECTPISGSDSLMMHTATLSEYNQQSNNASDRGVFEPIEISFNVEVT